MPFTENIKKIVKEKSAFKCCKCQSIGIQIHHIIPEEDGGPSDIDNAAPLCPNCHDYFGANPVKRKEMREIRDWCYGVVARTYPDNRQNGLLSEINSKVDQLQVRADKDLESLDALKASLMSLSETIINKMTAGTAVLTASSLSSLASLSPSPSPSPSPAPFENELDSNYCPTCQNLLFFIPDSGLCPHCGSVVTKNPFSR